MADVVICSRLIGDCLFRRVRPCRLWSGLTNGRGYGTYYKRGSAKRGVRGSHKNIAVHREALEQKLGRPLRKGYSALHHCDNRACYEPEHLYEGTQAENLRDMASRGRSRKPTPRIAAIEVEIVERYEAGGVSQQELGREYGIPQQTVGKIVARSRRTPRWIVV